ELEVDDPVAARVVGTIKFDPTAAEHIGRQGLLRRQTLDTLLAGGAQQITPFPATAIAIKPIYQVATARALVEGRYFLLKAWEGPPATPQPWSPTRWPAGVWI